MAWDHVTRRIQSQLASDPSWASGSVGRLARWVVDFDMPISVVAHHIGVRNMVLHRWLAGKFGIGGTKPRRDELHSRIETLVNATLPALRQKGSFTAATKRSDWVEMLPSHPDADYFTSLGQQ